MAAAAFLLFPLVLSLPLAASDDAGATPTDLLYRQDAQLRRLEALVESLSQTVEALEASLSAHFDHSFASPSSSALPLDLETVTHVLTPHQAVTVAGGGDRFPGVSVTKHETYWSERFQFAAAAQLEASPVVASVLPHEESDGHSKYFAVGDSCGRVYVFSSAGDVLVELPSFSDSPVTSMLSYLSSRRNESLLFSGHADGSVRAHRLYEFSANGEDWLALSAGSSKTFIRGSPEVDSPPVSGLEVHQVGNARYVIASDDGGRIRVFTENGSLYGTAIASSRPLAFTRQRLLFLTETGAASLDLRTMEVRETACEGLNGSVAKAYSFDSSERQKAYGFTAGGDLIHVVLLGDAANLKCRVRSVRNSELDGPAAIQTIKGYLLVANSDKVIVYNISSQFHGRVGAPRPLFSAAIQDIKSLFPNSEAIAGGASDAKPLIAADREKLVVLGLGNGYIGIYKSNFPLFRAETNAVVWSTPAFLFLLFLIGLWQFYVKKKDSFGWAAEDSFNSSSGASSTGVRTELRELREVALARAPARSYASPPRYAGGSSGLPFRTTGELNFRGQNVEPAGFPRRRETLFPNSEVAEDHHID